MKRYIVGLILGVIIPLNIGLGFIPYVPRLSSADENDLRFYPLPQDKDYPWSFENSEDFCDTVNIFQDRIYILASSYDSVVLEACKVCSAEIYKNFYHKFQSGDMDSIVIIPNITYVPPYTVIFVFGVKGDYLIDDALDLVESSPSDIPDKKEGYLLRSKVISGRRLIVVGAGKDKEGTFHSASTLRELIAQNTQCVVPREMTIKDYPDCEWRMATWDGLEVGCDTSEVAPTQKQLQKLDYLSLMKVNGVVHRNHRKYFDPPAADTPFVRNNPLYNIDVRYEEDVSDNNLDYWYPKYKHRGIEVAPRIYLFGQPHVLVIKRQPNAIAGTQDSVIFIVGSDKIARPIMTIPSHLDNPCFDDNGGSLSGWDIDSDSGGTSTATIDKNTKYSGSASAKLICKPGEYVRIRQVLYSDEFESHTNYIFRYRVKTNTALVDSFGGAYIKVFAYDSVDNWWVWPCPVMAFGPKNKTKWSCHMDSTLNWYEAAIGFNSASYEMLKFEIGISLSSSAPVYTVWVDGDPVMNTSTCSSVLTEQQRFLIMTDDAEPRVYKKSGGSWTRITDGYEFVNDSLSYNWEDGKINAAGGSPNGNWYLKCTGSDPGPGDTLAIVYNHLTHGDLFGAKCTYSPRELEYWTDVLVDTAIALTVNQLSPKCMDLVYNEVTHTSILRDGRAKESGKSAAQLLANDIDKNLIDSDYADILLSADALTPYRNGWKKDSIWKAIKLIPQSHRSNIIPWFWSLKDIEKSVDTLNDYNYSPLFAPYRGSENSYLEWMKTLEDLKGSRDIRGIMWHNDVSEGSWDDTSSAVVDKFAKMPICLDLAWNFGPGRVEVTGDTNDLDLCYSPETLHLHKGDIFSPVPARFRGRWTWIEDTSSSPVWIQVTQLGWDEVLNEDRKIHSCYKIERYSASGWDSLATLDPTTTSYVDSFPKPYLSEISDGVGKYQITTFYYLYRISSFDKLGNQSPFNYSKMWRKDFFSLSRFAKETAWLCQIKCIDPEGIFHIVYTGGMEDTLVFYVPFNPSDTLDNLIIPSDTLGKGMFPTEVAKGDTLGVAFLSKGMDTLYYSLGKESQWTEPYPLISSPYPKSFSVPRMALGSDDTLHITFVEKKGENNLTLYRGKFHLLEPSSITIDSISSWVSTDTSGSIEPLGAGVLVDYRNKASLAWAQNDTLLYYRVEDDSIIEYTAPSWGGALLTIVHIRHPVSTATTPRTTKSTTLSPGTVQPITPNYNAGVVWSTDNMICHSLFYTEDTIEILRDTIWIGDGIKNASGGGGFVSWQEEGNIFLSLWDAVNGKWSAPETLTNDSVSSYPQIEAAQFVDEAYNVKPARFILWTEKQTDSLYAPMQDIKTYEDIGEYGIDPLVYLKMGKLKPTPFTEYRNGIISFGNEDYMKVDYGIDSLVYKLPLIDTFGIHRLFVECYFDTTTPPEGWLAELVVNGAVIDSIALYPGQLTRLTKFLSKTVTAAGSLKVELLKITGSYVPCSRIIVTRFTEAAPQTRTKSQKAVTELIRIPKTFYLFPTYPNPTTKSSVIRFQLPVKAVVSLKIYDVSGRLVRSLIKTQNLEPGIYTIDWDGTNDRGLKLPTGVYFLRMETKDYKATRKVVVLK